MRKLAIECGAKELYDKYYDWSAGISTDQFGVTWALTYVDTNLDSDTDCFGDKKLCAATAVFSVSKSL